MLGFRGVNSRYRDSGVPRQEVASVDDSSEPFMASVVVVHPTDQDVPYGTPVPHSYGATTTDVNATHSNEYGQNGASVAADIERHRELELNAVMGVQLSNTATSRLSCRQFCKMVIGVAFAIGVGCALIVVLTRHFGGTGATPSPSNSTQL